MVNNGFGNDGQRYSFPVKEEKNKETFGLWLRILPPFGRPTDNTMPAITITSIHQSIVSWSVAKNLFTFSLCIQILPPFGRLNDNTIPVITIISIIYCRQQQPPLPLVYPPLSLLCLSPKVFLTVTCRLHNTLELSPSSLELTPKDYRLNSKAFGDDRCPVKIP